LKSGSDRAPKHTCSQSAVRDVYTHDGGERELSAQEVKSHSSAKTRQILISFFIVLLRFRRPSLTLWRWITFMMYGCAFYFYVYYHLNPL